MSDIFLKILNMSINASWLIVAVIALRFLLKKAPKWVTCILWALVAVRLICPFALESALSLLPSNRVIPEDITMSNNPEIHSGIPFVNNAVNPLIWDASGRETGTHTNLLEVIISVVSTLWIVGIVLMVLYSLISYIRLKRKVRASINVRDNIMVCDDIETPFILGFFEPMIYVPSFVTGETLELVIAHEKAHIERFDHWWKPLGMVLLSVYWFNPLCWIAYIILCRDIEAACDEKVIQGKENVYVAAYSQALLDLSVTRRTITACPLAFGETGVKNRIRDVINYRKPAFWIVLIAVVSCIAVGVFFLTNPLSIGDNTRIKEQAEHQSEDEDTDTGNAQTRIKGSKTYYYTKNSMTGKVDEYIYFYITLNEDGTFQWYETPISSFIGYGKYTIEDGILSLPLDKEICGYDNVNYFKYEDDKLTFIEEGSGNFNFVKLEDGAVFEYYEMPEKHELDDSAETSDIDNEIGVKLVLFDVKSTGCLLEIYQDGREVTGSLQTGQQYTIQKQNSYLEWVNLPLNESLAWEDIAYDLKSGKTTEIYINWENVYGKLEPGHYRMIKKIMDYRAPGDFDTYDVQGEFDILENGGSDDRVNGWLSVELPKGYELSNYYSNLGWMGGSWILPRSYESEEGQNSMLEVGYSGMISKILAEYTGVTYKNGIPDMSDVSDDLKNVVPVDPKAYVEYIDVKKSTGSGDGWYMIMFKESYKQQSEDIAYWYFCYVKEGERTYYVLSLSAKEFSKEQAEDIAGSASIG